MAKAHRYRPAACATPCRRDHREAAAHPPFAIRVVQHGDKRGRDYPPQICPLSTICATKPVSPSPTRARHRAGAGAGYRRAPADPSAQVLELLRFSGDLYGQEIEVAFHHFLRGEAKFDSLDALVAQMEKDCDEARRLLG